MSDVAATLEAWLRANRWESRLMLAAGGYAWAVDDVVVAVASLGVELHLEAQTRRSMAPGYDEPIPLQGESHAGRRVLRPEAPSP